MWKDFSCYQSMHVMAVHSGQGTACAALSTHPPVLGHVEHSAQKHAQVAGLLVSAAGHHGQHAPHQLHPSAESATTAPGCTATYRGLKACLIIAKDTMLHTSGASLPCFGPELAVLCWQLGPDDSVTPSCFCRRDEMLTRWMHCTVEKQGTWSSVRRWIHVAHSRASSLEYSMRGMMQYVFTHLHTSQPVTSARAGSP